ncbi:hypothetical protein FHK92_20015 [Pseudomonas brassicacearum subsp. neoaurantiaca]|uniref:Uncharacterized protein n=1 Tax=Pseudomonas brassicacearum subsp. neoaurantiaca TaxID=494916 RepID=A0A7V8UEF7_9PSED|nr:hypothetical protein [Pseudomonas brassicacearum subsp. neoaurantiaca]
MGASLLAIASDQAAFMLTDTPLSRASSLPQGGVVLIRNLRCLEKCMARINRFCNLISVDHLFRMAGFIVLTSS